MALSLPSSSSSSSRTWLYDVFPSFSGEDVRVNFLSHFLKELDRKLIISFKDNAIPRSRSLDPELKQAIKDSRIAVVIFSAKYASSSWCLNELLEIVKCSKEECGQMVIPVFYRMDPSHVRKQTGEFGQIFEETCKNQTEEVKMQWRRALTDVANITGFHSVNWDNEAKLIEEIANDVSKKLDLTPSKDYEDFVGIEDHIAELSVLLQLEAKEVRMVGLWGSSGIGKTTIARVLFNRLSPRFQGSIFIDRAFVSKSIGVFSRANPGDYNMKLHLQSRFLSKILGRKDIEISQLGELAERLKHHKVLILIDDLDDQVVLDALVGQTQWFGSGSRIIVVTNDKHFLRAHGIDHIYEVCLPSEKLAVEMLCQSAFRKKSPPEGFEELVAEVADHVGRLPLGLSVLGSSLRGREKEYWVDLLPMLQNSIDGKIERTLKVSYDGLSSKGDKMLFRHIACLFNGEKVRNLKLLLADSGMSVNVGLTNLADKSLIHVREDHVEIHRLLQEMGRSIVRLEVPEKREFLVDSQDICDVLSEGTGTQKVIGITLDTDEIDELYLHENAFTEMRYLRFIRIYTKQKFERKVKWHFPENLEYLPPKLKLLHWDNCPLRCLPSKFRPENLVKLRMENSKLEKLWEGIVALPCLKEMSLRGSQNLIEMPDLSKATNLEELDLEDCYSLVKLPSSIPHPNKLTKVNMWNCRNLETIPIGISLKSLEYLDLDGCSRLRTFPHISSTMADLNISKTEELPSNLCLKNLRFENLISFSMTEPSKKLWERVQPLTLLTAIMSPSLESLYLSDIPSLVELPCSFQNLHQLMQLSIRNCVNLETLPNGINLQSLEILDLSGCSRLRTFPDISTNIRSLYLSETAIEEVPWWIEKFSSLQGLNMNGCINLETLPTGRINLPSLWKLDLRRCSQLRTFPDISTNIGELCLSETAIEEVPCLIEKFTRLQVLEMNGCINLETLPTGRINLPSLGWLDLRGCSRLRTFPDISTRIIYLYLSETAIEEVPCWIEKFSKLEKLEMNGCNKLNSVNLNVFKLTRLEKVDFSDCKAMTGASWSYFERGNISISFNKCLTLVQEAMFQQNTYLGCQLLLSGEEVPSYFTHRTTTATSSSLTIPPLPSSLSQPSLRFMAGLVLSSSDNARPGLLLYFKGRFWNSFDSFGQAQDFQTCKELYEMKTSVKGSYLLILGFSIRAEMNYTHVDLQLDCPSEYKVKEWGIRLCSSADNRLGYPNTLPHVFQTDEVNTLNEAGEGQESEVTESSSKRMRISLKKKLRIRRQKLTKKKGDRKPNAPMRKAGGGHRVLIPRVIKQLSPLFLSLFLSFCVFFFVCWQTIFGSSF